jgi:hypothetical protein
MLIAGLVACPLALMLMNQWLKGYAYRVQLTPVPFIISVVALSLITAVLIILQTMKAGLEKPARALRSE